MDKDLNKQQEAALLGSFAKDTLVLAGAGSGKTKLLVSRINYLINDRKIEPFRIMSITFTNKAAKELKQRISDKCGEEASDAIWAGTFHSICIRLLKMYGSDIGLGKFTILSPYDAKKVLTNEMLKVGINVTKEQINNFVGRISTLKNNLVTPKDYRNSCKIKNIEDADFIEVYARFQRENLLNQTIDFDDIILYTTFLLQHSPNARKFMDDTFKYIHVDETQDSNKANITLFNMLALNCNLFLVGDIDQCWSKDNTIKTTNGIKHMNELTIGDEVLTLKKHNITMSKITNITQKVANTVKIKTLSNKEIYLTSNHKCFATQADFQSGYYYNYLMYRPDKGFRIGILSGGLEESIRSRAHCENPDKLWFIGQHKTMKDAVLMEETLSLRYQVPKNPYFHNGRGLALDQLCLDNIFNEFGINGWSIINDFKLQFDYPNYLRKSSSNGCDNIFNINLTMNTKKGGNEVSYERNGFKVRKTFSNYKNAYNYTNELKEKVGAKYINEQFSSLDNTRLNIIPVSQLTIGMCIPIIDNGEYKLEQIISIEKYKENDEVYDIEVEDTGILIANNIITHNCIYGWRGAVPQYLLENQNRFSLFKLEQNYRSTKKIVHASNMVIANNDKRIDKVCFTNNATGDNISIKRFRNPYDEAEFIAKEISAYKSLGINYNDIFILYRTNAQSRIFEDIFMKQGLPYTLIGALSFNERKEIKDCMAFARIKVNNKDKPSFNRALQCLEGIGAKAIKDIMDIYDIKRDILATIQTYRPKSNKISKSITFLYNLLSDVDKYNAVYNIINYFENKYIKENTPESATRIENLKEFRTLVHEKQVSKMTLESFVDEMDLMSSKDKENKTDSVSMLTIHASKGLESSLVFIAGCNQGILPHCNSTDVDAKEEERRLMYVAMTRAKYKLYITSYEVHGNRSYAQSQFITEIPRDCKEII